MSPCCLERRRVLDSYRTNFAGDYHAKGAPKGEWVVDLREFWALRSNPSTLPIGLLVKLMFAQLVASGRSSWVETNASAILASVEPSRTQSRSHWDVLLSRKSFTEGGHAGNV